MKCRLCGHQLSDGDVWCPECGEDQPQKELETERAYWTGRFPTLSAFGKALDQLGDKSLIVPELHEQLLDRVETLLI
jgi:hypothetical protein